MESEKLLEKKLQKEIKISGGWTLKLWSLSLTGLPDRLILMPGGKAYFAEVKTTGKKPKKIQIAIHNKLKKLGFKVFIIDSSEGIKKLINEIK